MPNKWLEKQHYAVLDQLLVISNLRRLASEARLKLYYNLNKEQICQKDSMGAEDKDAPKPQVRPADPYVTQQLVQPKAAEEPGSGGGIPFAQARFVDPPSAQQAEVVGYKTPERQQQQSKEKRGIKDIVDQKLKSGEPLTQAEISKAMQKVHKLVKDEKKIG
jgi:hypothetical protein